MSNRGMAVLGLRLFSLFLFYHSLTMLPEVYGFLSATDRRAADPVYYYLVAVAHIGPAVLGLLIWFYVGHWVNFILPQRTAMLRPDFADAGDWQGVAFIAVGLFLFLYALPDLLRTALQAYVASSGLVAPLDQELVLALATAGLRVCFGLGLVLGGRRLSGFFLHLRRLGVARS
jgi:hypothetical protein